MMNNTTNVAPIKESYLRDPVAKQFLDGCLEISELSLNYWLKILLIHGQEEKKCERIDDFFNKIIDFYNSNIQSLEAEYSESLGQTWSSSGFDSQESANNQSVSSVTMAEMKDLLNIKQIALQIQDIKTQLQKLWCAMDVPVHYQMHFLDENKEVSRSSLNAFEEEHDRCRSFLENNIEDYISKKKYYIRKMWSQCYSSAEEMNSFPQLHSTDHTLNLLLDFDGKIQKLEDIYNKNKVIFQTLTEFDKLLNSLLEKALNTDQRPNYKNRGAVLLEQEKEKNMLQGKIKKTEKKLLTLAKTYFEEHQTFFMVQGNTIEHYIKKQYKREDLSRLNPESALAIRSCSTRSTPKAASTRDNSLIKTKKKASSINLPTIKINQSKSDSTKVYTSSAKKEDSDDDWIDYEEFEVDCRNTRSTTYAPK